VVGPTAARTVTITSRVTVNPTDHHKHFSNRRELESIRHHRRRWRSNNLHGADAGRSHPSTQHVGTKDGALRITSNDTNEMVTDVALTGFGLDPNART